MLAPTPFMSSTDPTPAASTPAAAAVAPAPTKREAMANALNGIATAVPPLPRRNHATPAATCAALAADHHGHLSAPAPLPPPPPPRSSIAAATRVFGVSCGSGTLYERGISPTGGTRLEVDTCQPTDMWDMSPPKRLCGRITVTSPRQPATVTSQSHTSPAPMDYSMGRSSIGLLVGLLLLRFNWCLAVDGRGGAFPLVVSTWPFREAVRAAWDVVSAGNGGGSAVDAVVAGCSACEVLRCDGTGNWQATMEIGAVAAMRYVKDGIKAAKLVMDHSLHTLLVGEKATVFAISMGLPGPINLSSPESLEKWANWRQNHCQPNFWKNVAPAGRCGPYHPIKLEQALDSVKHEVERSQGGFCQEQFQSDSLLEPINSHLKFIDRHNHDTISMAVIDKMGHVAVGTSTNGATFKIPGRVGDGPIPGSSSYGDDEVGACGASGDGDIMMRFLPCYQVVESMRRGMEPRDAAMDAISRIARKFPNFVGALFAVNKKGVHAGACHGWTFQYSVRNSSMHDVEVITVYP